MPAPRTLLKSISEDDSFKRLDSIGIQPATTEAMVRKIFGIIIVGICFASTPAMATDATWFCSALLHKTDKQPTAFKFEVRGDQLIDYNVWQNTLFKRWEGPGNERPPTKFKIVQDTDKGLVATAFEFDKDSGMSVSMVLIDKVSNEFRQTIVTTKEPEPTINFAGTCQVGASR